MKRNEIVSLVKSSFLFKQYSEEELDLIVDQFKSWDYEKGDLIFEQGEPAENLFLVYRGKVLLSGGNGRRRRSLGVFESGDMFGYEMLSAGSMYRSSAIAQTNCTVLWLDQPAAAILVGRFPELREDLETLFNSYLLDLRTPLSWREPNEVIYYLGRRHPLDLLMRLTAPAVWALFSLIVLAVLFNTFPGKGFPWVLAGVDLVGIVVWVTLAVIDWANDYAIVSNRRVVFQEKVILLYASRHESPLRMVLSVSTQTDWMTRQFGYGDILIRTYAGEVHFPKVPRSSRIAVLIHEQAERAKNGLLVEEQEHLEDLVRATLGGGAVTDHATLGRETSGRQSQAKDAAGAAETARQVTPQVHSGALSHWLADLFGLRREENGVITYWTHWYILLKRIWLPTLILLVFWGALIARLAGALDFLEMPSLIAILLVGGPVALGWWLYQYHDWRNDRYIITPEQVIDIYKKPLGQEEKRAAPLKNILSIEFERQGIIGLLFNFGTVYIKVGESTLTFDYVYNPSDVQRELFSRLALRDEVLKNEQKMAMQKNMAGWIEAYHKVASTGEKPEGFRPDQEEPSF